MTKFEHLNQRPDAKNIFRTPSSKNILLLALGLTQSLLLCAPPVLSQDLRQPIQTPGETTNPSTTTTTTPSTEPTPSTTTTPSTATTSSTATTPATMTTETDSNGKKLEPTNRFGVKKSDIATDKETRKIVEPDQRHYLDSGGNDRCQNPNPYNVTPHGFFKHVARAARHATHFLGFPADIDKGFGPTCDLSPDLQHDGELKEAAATAPGVKR